MNRTPIEWTTFTVNPFRFRNLANGRIGHYCVKISPGCKFCYSGEMQLGPYLSGLDFTVANREKGELIFDEAVLEQVLRRKKPCKIFWCDMTDMFLADYPTEWIVKCLEVMGSTPHLLHQVLTKRPDRMLAILQDLSMFGCRPMPCFYFGTSVEDQERADQRRDYLWKIAGMGFNTFVSYEPALGPVDWIGWDFLKQGIVGGESGKHAREFSIRWARDAVKQWRSMGIPPFIKQLGSNPVEHVLACAGDAPAGTVKETVELIHPKGGDMSEWPADLQFVREGPFAATPQA